MFLLDYAFFIYFYGPCLYRVSQGAEAGAAVPLLQVTRLKSHTLGYETYSQWRALWCHLLLLHGHLSKQWFWIYFEERSKLITLFSTVEPGIRPARI